MKGMTRDRVRRFAGYWAAIAMLPYLVIKIFWTVDGLRGGGLRDGAWSRLDWAAINALTVGMAGLAVLLGLALARPWGNRLPGGLLLFPAWIGGGFLVPMLPLMPILLLLTIGNTTTTTTAEAAAALPALEVALVSVSFAGFALGVAVAFPLYVLQRWPDALKSRLPAGTVDLTTARVTAGTAAVLGLSQIYWALGGTLGLDPAALDRREAQWHLLTGNSGLWALIAAWGVWTVTHRAAGPRSLLLTWLASGFLLAWGSWKAAFAFAAAPEFPPPEFPVVLSLQNHFGALAGLAILLIVLRRAEQSSRLQPVA
jgi:hypothetical protein